MSCYNCAKGFSLFNREKACKNCGFGFCAKCVAHKAVLPATGATEQVCRACFKILSGESQARPVTPPSALERRLEHLDAPPPAKPIVVYRGNQKMDRLRKGLSVEDQKIVDRLEQLHRDRKTSEKMPSDREMADRLAKLKNVPSPSEEDEERPGQGRSFYAKPDTRADAAKTEDLLKQMGEEVSMDAQAGGGVDPTEEIAERLAKLKGFKQEPKPEKSHIPAEEEELPSDEEADRLLDQLMEEQRLEDKARTASGNRAGGRDKDEEMEEADDDTPPPIDNKMIGLVRQLTRDLREEEEEELPWCNICNEDAEIRPYKSKISSKKKKNKNKKMVKSSYRCKDCDGDLFCHRCFVECHSEFDLRHKREPYRRKKQAEPNSK